MSEILVPALRAGAITAFITGLVFLLLNPPSLSGLEDLLVILAGATLVVLVTAWITVRMIGREVPEPEFRRLVDRSEKLAMLPPPDYPPSRFDELVMEALDDLPERFREILEDTPVTVSRRGHEFGAYGHYIGGTIARRCLRRPHRRLPGHPRTRLRPRPGPTPSAGRAHGETRARTSPGLG